MKKERVMQISLWVVGALSALVLSSSTIAAITIAAVGSTLVILAVILQVVNYKDWHESKPSTFWCASGIGATLAFLLVLVLMEFSIIEKDSARISMIAVLPSITPIIGVLIANIIRVIKKESAVFIE